jgi:hypothetical protein
MVETLYFAKSTLAVWMLFANQKEGKKSHNETNNEPSFTYIIAAISR